MFNKYELVAASIASSLPSYRVSVLSNEPDLVSKDCNLLSCKVCSVDIDPVSNSSASSLPSYKLSTPSKSVILVLKEELGAEKAPLMLASKAYELVAASIASSLPSYKVSVLSKEPVLVSKDCNLLSCKVCSVYRTSFSF